MEEAEFDEEVVVVMQNEEELEAHVELERTVEEALRSLRGSNVP